ncbi:hypothetical protein [Sphingomonas sp. MS122]|uniref:hypothetical protein n=1 Tax=Sphingomonas sp. MS122 TaxID=3412683 RepID=UPI003C2D9FCE
MKEIMFGGAAVALAAGAYFHGPLKTGETYDRPAHEVYRVVESTPLPSLFDKMVYNQRGGAVTRGGEPEKSMIWYFHANGLQVAKYTVNIIPVSEGKTRVQTSFEMSDDAEKALGKGFAIQGADQYKVIGRVSMNEQIDSRLDKRSFDTAKVSEAMSAYILVNMKKVQGEALESMDKAAEQFKKMDEERAYQDAQENNRKYKAGEPMTGTTPSQFQ